MQLEEAAYLAALPKAPTTIILSAGPGKPPIGATGSSIRWRRPATFTADAGKAAKAKPLKVNIRPFGTQIYAADYFAEEVRRRWSTSTARTASTAAPNAPASAMA